MTGKWVKEGRRGAAVGTSAAAEPARLEAPLGQGPTFEAWLRRARRLSLPHALVVEGPRGGGKTTVAKWLTAALLCPSELDPDGPCGVCRVCSLVANDQHADVHVLSLAEDDADKEANKHLKKSFYVISVDQVRHAQAALQRHAVEGRARVLRIDDADCMEEPAQNALLKTLEEPGQATFLLLETSSPEKLLPTVRSRVQRLRVRPLDQPTLLREISRRLGDPSQVRSRMVELARGSLGAALDLHTEQAVQLHDLVLAMLDGTKGLRPLAIADAVLQQSKERRFEQQAARKFLWLLRSELRARCCALAQQAAGSYPAATSEPWTSWIELTLSAERDLDLQIPAEQVLAACLLQFVA
jgi:DNA polymerase-3 subunit delta'